MSDSLRHYLHATLVILGVLVFLCAGVILAAAMTLFQYAIAVAVLALAFALLWTAHVIDPRRTGTKDGDGI